MNNLSEQIHELNEMFIQGRVIEAFDKFYAEDVVMQENDLPPTIGKEANRKREIEFVENLIEVREANVLNVAIGIGCTMVEWHLDYSHKEWGVRNYKQIAVQEWENGQIVKERFYYGS